MDEDARLQQAFAGISLGSDAPTMSSGLSGHQPPWMQQQQQPQPPPIMPGRLAGYGIGIGNSHISSSSSSNNTMGAAESTSLDDMSKLQEQHHLMSLLGTAGVMSPPVSKGTASFDSWPVPPSAGGMVGNDSYQSAASPSSASIATSTMYPIPTNEPRPMFQPSFSQLGSSSASHAATTTSQGMGMSNAASLMHGIPYSNLDTQLHGQASMGGMGSMPQQQHLAQHAVSAAGFSSDASSTSLHHQQQQHRSTSHQGHVGADLSQGTFPGFPSAAAATHQQGQPHIPFPPGPLPGYSRLPSHLQHHQHHQQQQQQQQPQAMYNASPPGMPRQHQGYGYGHGHNPQGHIPGHPGPRNRPRMPFRSNGPQTQRNYSQYSGGPRGPRPNAMQRDRRAAYRQERARHIHAQAQQILSKVMPLPSEVEDKKSMIERLQQAVAAEWSESRIEVYGSSATLFALRGADVDSTLFVDEDVAQHITINEEDLEEELHVERKKAERTKPLDGRHASDKWLLRQQELEKRDRERKLARLSEAASWASRAGAQFSSEEAQDELFAALDAFDNEQGDSGDEEPLPDDAEGEVASKTDIEAWKALVQQQSAKTLTTSLLAWTIVGTRLERTRLTKLLKILLDRGVLTGSDFETSILGLIMLLEDLQEEYTRASQCLAVALAIGLAQNVISGKIFSHSLVLGLPINSRVALFTRTMSSLVGRAGKTAARTAVSQLDQPLLDMLSYMNEEDIIAAEADEAIIPDPHEALKETGLLFLLQDDDDEEQPGPDKAATKKALTSNAAQQRIVLKLAKILAEAGMEDILPLPRARVPIVKYHDPLVGMSCDICINNRLATRNTQLLNFYASLDQRLVQLTLIIKYWAKQRNINSPYRGTLSSYAYVILVIFFLQMRRPPVLPPLQQIRAPPSPNSTAEPDPEINGHNVYFCEDRQLLARLGFGAGTSMNTESLGELLVNFFRFYAYDFDYHAQVVSVRMGRPLTKEEKEWTIQHNTRSDRFWWCIEDPFELSHNLGRVADKDSLYCMRGEFMRAAKILSDSGDLMMVVEPFHDENNDPTPASS